MTRIERVTSPLPRECSTTEPHGHRHGVGHARAQARGDGRHGAGDGNRTRVISLEGWGSTIELLPPGRPRGPCYKKRTTCRRRHRSWWRRLDSNQRRRKPTDLQSAPFNHSGTPPRRTVEYIRALLSSRLAGPLRRALPATLGQGPVEWLPVVLAHEPAGRSEMAATDERRWWPRCRERRGVTATKHKVSARFDRFDPGCLGLRVGAPQQKHDRL